MTHNEKRTTWWKEGLAALFSGGVYGITNALAGHPLDTVKTKMQVIKEYSGRNMIASINLLWKVEGFIGFFRGIFPAMMGSGAYRACQFAVFEAVYTKLDKRNSLFTSAIPLTAGLELRVIIAGITAGTVRAFIECPFEYSKVQRQTGQIWKAKKIYYGFYSLWIRAVGVLTCYFTLVDMFRRNTNAYKHHYGIFLMNGFCSTAAWAMIWPFEIAKNQIQSSQQIGKTSIFKILKQRVIEQGIINGLFRGSLPGLLSVYIRSGVSMIVMLYAQKLITMSGFRN